MLYVVNMRPLNQYPGNKIVPQPLQCWYRVRCSIQQVFHLHKRIVGECTYIEDHEPLNTSSLLDNLQALHAGHAARSRHTLNKAQ